MRSNGIINFRNARFTVISHNCIRLEYSENNQFVDEASWFAVNRDEYCDQYSTEQNGERLAISTNLLTLNYRDDGQPFSPSNLNIRFETENDPVIWYFGQKNQMNLGGTLQTLDDLDKAVELPEGLLSRDGWYYLDDSKSHIYTHDWIESRPESCGSDGYFWGYGNDYKSALQSLTSVSGKAPLPRKYVLGSWYSRWFSYTSEDYMQIVKEFDEHDFPLDILVMDMDWHRKEDAETGHGWADMLGWTGWSWDTDLIKEPETFLDWCHEQNLHVTLNVHPHDGIRPHEDCYKKFMQDMGEETLGHRVIPFQAGNKKYMDAYFNAAHKPLEDQGVDFWWVDWQQDSIMPYADGIDDMEHLPLLNHCYYNHTNQSGKRGLSFSRWAGWGDQRYPIHFSGDAACNWDMLAFEIYFTSTAGNVGCFYWSHDIGGFHGERNPELYARWVQFGIATAALRLHSTGDELDRRPWKWGSVMEKSMRKSFKLRSQLIPYLYSVMHQCYIDSLPMNRPMYLEYPENDIAYKLPYQYLLGDGFLVAPVIQSGVGENYEALTTVWLPEGIWVDWFTGEYKEGPCSVDVVSDINSFPLFVKGSYPVVMQPESNRMTSEVLDQIIIRCYHSNCRQTTQFYEDDGISDDYKNDKYGLTEITYEGKDKSAALLIGASKGSYSGQVLRRSYKVELTCPEISEVMVNDESHEFIQNDGVACIDLEDKDIRNEQYVKIIY